MILLTPASSTAIGACPHQATVCASCILDSSDYFATLSAAAKQALQAVLQRRVCERRTMLYQEGQLSEHLFILLSGEVKIYKSLPSGRQQIHKLIAIPGDLIGCEDIYHATYSSTAEAIGPVVVCHWRKSELQTLAESQPEITDTLMRSMARNLNAYVQHIANLGQKSALERVASYLVFMVTTHAARNLCHQRLRESLTRSELADLLGITQRTLIRSLKSLEQAGLLSLTRDGFVIHDHDALTALSSSRE
jgi:CRP/FNR family transcriptional regulator